MRNKKDNIFYYESGSDTDPREKNTVQRLVKTLADTQPRVTTGVVDSWVSQPVADVAEYDYRTEVSSGDDLEVSPRHRYLIGLSQDGMVEGGGGAGEQSTVDARIRARNESGDTLFEVLLEAKVGSNALSRGQLSAYADDFRVAGHSVSSEPWATAQWLDVYRELQETLDWLPETEPPSRDRYLVNEFSSWLLQRDLVQGILGEKATEGNDGEVHRKQIRMQPTGVEGDVKLLFWAQTRGADKDGSATIEVPQESFRKLFKHLDEEDRETVFIDGDLQTYRRLICDEYGLSETDLESGTTFKKVERAGYDDPAGLMLRFDNDNYFKINRYNVNGENGWSQYMPILTPTEWKAVFTEVTERLTPSQKEQFTTELDIGILWSAYLANE
jgi:hypothetical protein